MRISRRRVKFYGLVLLNYILMLAFAGVVFLYEDNAEILLGKGVSNNGLSIFSILLYHVYRYALNFPFGAYNWFNDDFLYTTIYYIVPNSILSGWVILKIYPHKRKRLVTYLQAIMVTLLLLILIYTILYLFISGFHF